MVAGKGEYAFNEFFHIGVEQGVIVFLIFFGGVLVIALQNITSLFKDFDPIKSGILGTLISQLVFAFFSYPFSMAPLLLNFFLILALLSSMNPGKSYLVDFKSFPGISLTIIFVALSILSLLHLKNIYSTYEHWETASRFKQYHDYERAIEEMEKLENNLWYNGGLPF